MIAKELVPSLATLPVVPTTREHFYSRLRFTLKHQPEYARLLSISVHQNHPCHVEGLRGRNQQQPQVPGGRPDCRTFPAERQARHDESRSAAGRCSLTRVRASRGGPTYVKALMDWLGCWADPPSERRTGRACPRSTATCGRGGLTYVKALMDCLGCWADPPSGGQCSSSMKLQESGQHGGNVMKRIAAVTIAAHVSLQSRESSRSPRA